MSTIACADFLKDSENDQGTTREFSVPIWNTDPKEREPVNYPYLHTWVGAHVARILGDFEESIKREPVDLLRVFEMHQSE